MLEKWQKKMYLEAGAGAVIGSAIGFDMYKRMKRGDITLGGYLFGLLIAFLAGDGIGHILDKWMGDDDESAAKYKNTSEDEEE